MKIISKGVLRVESERFKRLSRRLLSQMEDFYIHEPSEEEKKLMRRITPEDLDRELKVARSEKTRNKLERWFRERGIPIRIIYGTLGESRGTKWSVAPTISPIGKPGVITFYYSSPGGKGTTQDLPTAWIIVHNLFHGINDLMYYNTASPYERDRRDEVSYAKKTIHQGETKYNIMGEDKGRPGHYPTTKSYQQGKLTEIGEGYPEIFTQWVVTGKVILHPRNPEAEKDLEQRFRDYIDYLAKKGVVIYNI